MVVRLSLIIELKNVCMVHAVIPLNCLLCGQAAFVNRISGPPDHVQRLEELGLRGGVRIEMFRPGSPCIIRMAGNKVCIRSGGILEVLVQPETPLS